MGPGAELTSRVEHHESALVLALQGQLTPADAAAVRTAILPCWGECPAALVLDLSAVRVVDDAAVLVLPAVLREARDWPPVPVLLCTPDPVLARRLPELRWFPDRDQALAAAGATGGTADRVAVTLPATPQAPAQARAVLNQACRTWQLVNLAAPAEVVVSELCANAVVHARTPMSLVIRRTPSALHIVVRDWSSTPPRPRPLPATGLPAESGNGLQLVAAFASGWGTMPAAGGKAVWASLRIEKEVNEQTDR
jgi:anti-anti-sigma regulatory factor/anti-sigma regulatory factor (Ser/Thr protein kinase)